MQDLPGRTAPTSEDPLGEAVAAAPELVPRSPGPPPDLGELRDLIQVSDLTDGEPGYNTEVILRDGILEIADVADDFEAVLVRQPGIERAEGVEREFWVVQSTMSLPDVAAAVATALFELNRVTRSPRVPGEQSPGT